MVEASRAPRNPVSSVSGMGGGSLSDIGKEE